METSSSTGQPPELSSRYYKAEVACWSFSGILLVCKFIGIAPDQTLPFLKITPTDSLGYIRALGALLLAAWLYLFVEWKLSEQAAREARGRSIRFTATCIWILTTLWLSYPLLAQDSIYAIVPQWWFLAFIADGIIMGMFTSILIYSAFLIRSREESEQLHLPRIPFPAKVNLTLWTPVVLLMLVLYYVLLTFSPPPIHGFAIVLVSVPFLYFGCAQLASFYLARNENGQRLSFAESLEGIRKANNVYDYSMFLSQQGTEFLKDIDVDSLDSPEELQEAIRRSCSNVNASNSDVQFNNRQDETSEIEVYAKDGDPSNEALNNVGINIHTKKDGFVKVTLIPTSKDSDNKKMQIPTASVEAFAEEYLSKQDRMEESTLQKALSHGMNQTAIKLLLEQVKLPLHEAVNSGESEAVDYLISKDEINVNEAGAFGWTPLLLASAHGYVEIIDRLLEAGANPEIANVKGMTPLLYASRYGNLEVCSSLLDYGADVNAQNVTGNTPLIYASCDGNLELVNKLLDAGAKTDLKTLSGETALELAYENKQGKIAKRLKEAMHADDPS